MARDKSQFALHRREIAIEGASAFPDLVPVVVADAREVPKASAVAAKQTESIEIVLPGGIRVTVRGRLEERTPGTVLAALRSV